MVPQARDFLDVAVKPQKICCAATVAETSATAAASVQRITNGGKRKTLAGC